MYSALVAQAQRMELTDDRLVLTFAASQKIAPTFEKYKATLEGIAQRVAGRRIAVVSEVGGEQPAAPGAPLPPVQDEAKKSALKEQALADPAVQALFEVFPGDIRDVEEL